MGRVHQQQADARVLLLRKLIRPQAPQIPQRKIAGTVQICILAVMAALAQEQRPAKGPAKAGGKQGCGICSAIVIYSGKVAVLPPSTLLRKRTFASRRRLFPSINRASSSPHAGGGYAVTHQVAGGKILRAAAQKAVQAIYLARRPENSTGRVFSTSRISRNTPSRSL